MTTANTMMRRVVFALALAAGAVNCGPTGHPPIAYEVRFPIGQDAPSDATELATIERAATLLQGDPAMQALIIGHADSQGDAARNRELSLRRARRVRQMVIARGVGASRLRITARGEDEQAASNQEGTGRAQNRRVEVFMYDARRGTFQAQYGIALETYAE